MKENPRRTELLDELRMFVLESKLDLVQIDILSALVNLVDTVRENPEEFGPEKLQEDRERDIVTFLLHHN